MIAVHAMYERRSAGDRFDMDYLRRTRIPFVRDVLRPYGLIDIEVHAGVAGVPDGTPAKYCCVIVLRFETLEGFRRAFREEAARMNPGILEFTNIVPIVDVTEVVPA